MLLFLCIYWAGVQPSPLELMPFIGPLCQPRMMDVSNCGTIGEKNDC
jgi:hypothetical protein